MQASRKINVIATRKLLTWDPVNEWSATATASRSIAWALADSLTNDIYGGRLPDSRIDLQALYDLDAIWSARGDTFDGRFDNSATLWEGITQIAQAGRAKPYIQGGIVRFARDAAAEFPVALFSMRNIVRGSFGIEYILPSETTADAVEATYVDNSTWTPQTVTAYIDGSSAALPAKITLFGVTEREQAYREAMYQAAANRYRRKLIKFSTEMEGFIPAFGDLIAIQHDMPAWGQFAEVTAWNDATKTLTVSEPLTWDTGTHYIGLRKKDGSMEGPIVVTAGANAYELVLATPPTFAPYAGSAYERTHVSFGWAETWRQEARVVAVRPRGMYQVEIEAVNEDPSVHTAEDGITAPAVNSSQLPTLYTAPVVRGLVLVSLPSDPSIMLMSWQQASGADYYIIEQSQDSSDWTRVAETRAANYSGKALYGGATIVRVAAVGLTRGLWVTVSYGDSADYMWTTDSALMWDAVTSELMWRY
jgi:predicted phage tail protein